MESFTKKIQLKFYSLFYRLYKFSERKTIWLTSAISFLGGIFINNFSENTFSFQTFIRDKYSLIGHPENLITYIASAIILLLLLGKTIKYFIKTEPELIVSIYEEYIDPILKDLHKGKIAWGQNITILRSPLQRDGWKWEQISIINSGISYNISQEETEDYKNFKIEIFDKIYHTDNENRCMLYRLPSSNSDMPNVKLDVKRVKWSEFQFFRRNIENENFRKEHLQKILNTDINTKSETIDFPNSLCLHLIVETSDEKILLTQNSVRKKGDYAGSWACSIGEQIDFEDFKASDPDDVPQYWVKRALEQELGVTSKNFGPNNIRFMALNLEANNINFAIVAIVTLNINYKQLNAVMDKHPKVDEEYDDWKFIGFEEIHNELVHSKQIPHHPSTGIRLIYASLYKYGAAETNLRILKAKKRV